MKEINRLLCRLILFCVVLCPGWAQADTKKIEGTTNVEDCIIDEGTKETNAETNIVLYHLTYSSYDKYILIRVKNVTTELGVGATITACVCSLYCCVNTTNDNISVYRVFKPWTEAGATWNDWITTDYEWATGGCNNADDEGEDNSGDGTGADRKATAEGNAVSVTETGWYSWDISTTLAQGWYDETMNEEGIVLIGSINTGENRFYSTEFTTDPTLCPFFVFTYTTDGEPPEEKKNRRRRIIITGE